MQTPAGDPSSPTASGDIPVIAEEKMENKLKALEPNDFLLSDAGDNYPCQNNGGCFLFCMLHRLGVCGASSQANTSHIKPKLSFLKCFY